MYDGVTHKPTSSYRDWRGEHELMKSVYRIYDFPVTTYRMAVNGEREIVCVEAATH